nr:hypothetical protein [Tanacetum cinerariifolium]
MTGLALESPFLPLPSAVQYTVLKMWMGSSPSVVERYASFVSKTNSLLATGGPPVMNPSTSSKQYTEQQTGAVGKVTRERDPSFLSFGRLNNASQYLVRLILMPHVIVHRRPEPRHKLPINKEPVRKSLKAGAQDPPSDGQISI